MKKTYTKMQIREAIEFWQKRLDESDETGEKTVVLSLVTSDYGGGSDESTEVSLDDISSDGVDWLEEQFDTWKEASKEADPDAYDELYADDFDRITWSYLSKIVKKLMKEFNATGKKATYALGSICGNHGTWIEIDGV